MSSNDGESPRHDPPQQRGDDEAEDDADRLEDNESLLISNAQRAYLESNNSKKQLFLMCFGLTDDEGATPMLDLDAEPWNTIKKRDIKPTRLDYTEEILRRSNQQRKPANWGLNKCMEWLQEHPLVDQQDIEFLKNEVHRVRAVILNAQQEVRDEEARRAGGQWRGPIPYMRLILCLTEDAVKAAFLRRADARTRQELDARNSDVRPPTAFELIADKWNDKDFNPVAPASECHEDFAAPTNCAHSQVATLMPATSQRVEDALASIRSNLLRVIQDWERSGQGEGGRHAGDDDDEEDGESAGDPENSIILDTESARFGSLVSRSECALQNRAAFLRGKPPYLLYFWEVAENHQLLRSALQRLDDDVGASDASSAPSTNTPTSSRRRRQSKNQQPQQQAAPSQDISDLSESIRFHARAEDGRQVRRRIAELQDQARNYRRMYAESDDPNSARARFYQDEVEQIMHEIASLEEPLIATPISRNGTPRTPRTP